MWELKYGCRCRGLDVGVEVWVLVWGSRCGS